MSCSTSGDLSLLALVLKPCVSEGHEKYKQLMCDAVEAELAMNGH